MAETPVLDPAAPVASDWRTYVTDDLKGDPVVSKWAEKASEKDIPSLIKGYAHLNQRLGSAINLPAKDAKPDEVQALRSRLYDAGVFERPPSDPKDYGITKPEQLAEGVAWNDELAGKLAATLHKHGASKALAGELLTLYGDALTGTVNGFKTSQDEGMKTLRLEHGEHFDERYEATKRMIGGIFRTQEELDLYNNLGLGDHPAFLSVMMRLAPLALSDSSFMREIPQAGGEVSRDEAKAELGKIMSDKTHPMHAGYWMKDPKVMAHIDDLYRRVGGNQPVNIGTEGINIGG